MPDWMLRISNFSPVKWGIYALEGTRLKISWRTPGKERPTKFDAKDAKPDPDLFLIVLEREKK